MSPPPGGAASRIVSLRTATVLLLLVIALWGANWPVMKIGLRYMPPLTFAATRMLLGALVLFAFNAVTGRLLLPSRNDWRIVASVGLMQMGGFLMCVTSGLQYVDAGRSSILAYTTSLWVIPLAALVLRERLSLLKFGGFVLAMGGVCVLFNPFGFEWTDPDVVLGNGLLLLGAVLSATQIVHVRRHHWEASPLQLAPWQFSIAVLVLAPAAFFLEGQSTVEWAPALYAILLYNGPVATAFCFWAVITVTRALPAITTSLATLGVPVTGVLVSALVLGEALTPTNVGGLALILSGLALAALADRRHALAAAA